MDCHSATIFIADNVTIVLALAPPGESQNTFGYPGVGGLYGSIGMDGPWDMRRILGTAPVAPDGSAVVRIPANTPIAVQPLDDEGKALQLMRSWFVAMPGEVLSCVGCHEDKWTSPAIASSPKALSRPSSVIGRNRTRAPVRSAT
mgnify:CR=1 FL=1